MLRLSMQNHKLQPKVKTELDEYFQLIHLYSTLEIHPLLELTQTSNLLVCIFAIPVCYLEQ